MLYVMYMPFNKVSYLQEIETCCKDK